MSAPPLANASVKSTGSESTPGQQVVGEDDLLFGAGLRFLAGGFLVEHGRGERRGVAARARRLVRCVHGSPSSGSSCRWRDRRPFLTRVSGAAPDSRRGR